MVELRLNLEIDEQEMLRATLDFLAGKLNRVFNEMKAPIEARTRAEIRHLILGSRETLSLMDPQGELRGQLGVVDAGTFIEEMINAICGGVLVTVQLCSRVGDTLRGGLTVGVLRGDFSEVLGLAGATYTSEQGHQIDWLDWLLLGGSENLVTTHWYLHTDDTEAHSRTDLGIMVPVGGTHRGWSIFSAYSGIAENNWLTRALRPLVERSPRSILHEVFEDELNRRLH